MSDADLLREHYNNVEELDRRREVVRYSALLLGGDPVVVHVFSREFSARIRDAERFFATLGRAAAIHHESLVRPHSWRQTKDGVFHVAYPRLDPKELVPGSLSATESGVIGVQLARALVAVHGAGLVHGAITTQRISQRLGGGTQLNDFGLFAALIASDVSIVDAASALSETAYLSPETQKGKVADQRSDIYSLGASLFELLTGKPPYGGRTTSHLIASLLADTGEREARAGRSDPIVEALLRAIEHAPDDRWPTAAALANALANGLASGEAGKSPARRRGCLPFGTALVAAAVGVIGVLASQ